MDNTISNSSKAVCDTYNYLYKDHSDFKPAIWQNSQEYDFKDVCPLIYDNNPRFIFEDEYFFNHLEFMDDDTYDVLRELNEKYEIIVASIGSPNNLSYKALWLKNNLPFITNYVLINNGNCEMNKSIINMKYKGNSSIFIDDVLSNLISSNADFKFIYGRVHPWNSESKYPRLKDWNEVGNVLL
jgi:5'(3')-deoxyribonucleotidase